MRLSNRSFPYPVVNNADDVPEAAFQATFDFESDKTNFSIKATVNCSSVTLQKMIKKGTACYTLHVECSNTLYRRTFDFTGSTHRETIPANLIHDTVEVNAFVRAKVEVQDYRIEGAHDDYADEAFAIGPGDILAVADSQTFDADNSVDPMRLVGSLMLVERSPKPGVHAMEADMTDAKIRILLCQEDYDAYAGMKSVKHLTVHLTTTLVLPVLIEAIHSLDDPDTAPDTKWARTLRARLEGLTHAKTANALEKAQLLLELPIRRALASATTYADQPAT